MKKVSIVVLIMTLVTLLSASLVSAQDIDLMPPDEVADNGIVGVLNPIEGFDCTAFSTGGDELADGGVIISPGAVANSGSGSTIGNGEAADGGVIITEAQLYDGGVIVSPGAVTDGGGVISPGAVTDSDCAPTVALAYRDSLPFSKMGQ